MVALSTYEGAEDYTDSNGWLYNVKLCNLEVIFYRKPFCRLYLQY